MNLHLTMPITVGIYRLAKAPYGGIPGLTIFTGNQHNENWEWDMDALQKLPTKELVEIWNEHRPSYLTRAGE